MPESNAQPDPFDRLLSEMSRIAEVVNKFEDVKCQRSALDALVRTFGAPVATLAVPAPARSALTAVPTVATAQVPDSVDDEPGGGEQAGAKGPVRRKRAGKRQWEPDRNIEFWPEGLQSFTDLVAEKAPASHEQKHLVAIYWLEQVAEIKEIGPSQVAAAYKACGWPESADLSVALRRTAHRTNWIDTANSKALATTPTGRNAIKHESWIKKEPKSA